MNNLSQSLARQAQSKTESVFSKDSDVSLGNWKFTDDQLFDFFRLTVEACARVIESEPLTDALAAQHLRRRMLGK